METQLKNIEINPQFKRALDFMEYSSFHVFITGKAGTGKSTLLEYFRKKTKKKTAVLAPTGVAALNVKGQTIHSFCKFKPDITLDKVRKTYGKKRELCRNLDAVIIDEISMVRADLLDCMEKFFRLNGPHPKTAFGGIQMIFIGDLYQLPPVVTSSERAIFSSFYKTPYFFSARIFKDPHFKMEFLELEKVYRQTQKDFLGLLNAVRNRSITEEEMAQLNARFDPGFDPPMEDFFIYLTSTNDLAAKHNRDRLARLPGKSATFTGFIEGEFKRSSLPTDEVLELKPGAQIMLVHNDSKHRWVNGTLGKIIDIKEKNTDDPLLRIELQNGNEVDVGPNVWEIFRYDYDPDSKKIVTEPTGAFTQYPVKLAWAVTIHKSQGKTFDKVVIDIGRGTFAHGQMYVALSRCTNFEGIVLKKRLKKSHIRMDYRIVNFLTRFQYKKSEEQLSYAEKYEMILDAIREGRDLEIIYLKPNDTKSIRRITPEAVEEMTYMDKEFEGVTAYCHKRKAERVFRIDRMLEIHPIANAK